MASRLTFPIASARHAASLARDLLSVVREVNDWRRERDAFVAMHVEEMRRRAASEGLGKPSWRSPRA